MKFWLTLIVGTIAISAGLTFLNLYKGAQTLSYPPPAKPVPPSRVKFLEVSHPGRDITTLIRANAVTFRIPDCVTGTRYEASVRLENEGEADLILTFKESSSNKEGVGTLDVTIDDTRITGTNPRFKLAPKGSALLKLAWTPTRNDIIPGDAPWRSRGYVRFDHNDDRLIDDLLFEIRSVVTR